MKKFSAPLMEIQRLVSEDVFTASGCSVEALSCERCYCPVVTCPTGYCTADGCTGCYTYWECSGVQCDGYKE